ncbi:FXSXX-COOH protein [Thermocatellispora tengchongensis]|uniref:FXSXX-COOH protein n=1 Tax=Thermocatellispora tengchongensis TaxID=1073253 RepID=A0A840PJ45_9ACTN|nr:hypothetical protein [Thermocatellispora tengchongensis]MBB5139142.1 FXSXX-COOH protein [Thermocatellispora tengchongensis]
MGISDSSSADAAPRAERAARGDGPPGERPAGAPVVRSDLVDLTGLDIERIAAMPPSVLAESLRRIYRENAGISDVYNTDFSQGSPSPLDET